MSKKIARIKIALNGIVPQIYRRVEVPLEFSLRDLHFTIQDAMPWKCSHLYEFEIGEMSYGDPHPPNDPHGFGMIDAASKKLASLIKSKGDRFLYTYDFGDNWRHRIIAEKVLDPDPKTTYPRLIGGKRQAPPDDVGGIWGYEEFLKIMSDPKHPEYEDWQDWFDEDFDPEEFDSERLGWLVGNQGTKRAFESLENVRIPRYLSGRGKKS